MTPPTVPVDRFALESGLNDEALELAAELVKTLNLPDGVDVEIRLVKTRRKP